MQFLADESCDFRVVRALRDAGRDVLAIIEFAKRLEDGEVIALAAQQKRIALTEDKDFGQLVYAHAHTSSGVILIRYPTSARQGLAVDVLRLVEQRGDTLYGSFVVLEPGRIRIGRLPG